MPNDPHGITDLNARVVGSPQGGAGDGGGEGSGSGGESGVGLVLYVNNDSSNLLQGAEPGADRNEFGRRPNQPLATIDFAIGLCAAGRGDKIIVMPGHAENALTAVITLDVQGVTIEGRGRGANRPSIGSATASIDLFTVTAADCKIENILFNEVTGAVNSLINVAAADFVIEGCQFDLGASNTNPAITWASGARLKVLNNQFLITANGPAVALEVEATSDGLLVEGNLFNGGSTTNQWDTAAINSGQAHTNAIIKGNEFLYGDAMVIATSVSTLVMDDNVYGVNAFPTASTPVTLYADNGSTVRTGLSLEAPTTLVDAISKVRDGVGDLILCLPGTYTQTAALGFSTSKDAMRLLPLIDNGTYNVTITTNADVDSVTLAGANCEIGGIRFLGNATQSTAPKTLISSAGSFNRLHDCIFDCANIDGIDGINCTTASVSTIIEDSYFDNCDAADVCVIDLGANNIVRRNIFELPEDAAGYSNTGTALDGGMIYDNVFNGDATNGAMCVFEPTAVIDYAFFKNMFTGAADTTPYGQDAQHVTQHCENYVADTNGGLLIDPVA